MRENDIASLLVNICFNIHQQYGPGFFESVYEELVCYEMRKMSIPYVRQSGIRLYHEGTDMGIAFRPDLIVDELVLVELKSIENLLPVHFKQVITYLKLADLKLGLLVNFNVVLFKNGIRRVVNNL